MKLVEDSDSMKAQCNKSFDRYFLIEHNSFERYPTSMYLDYQVSRKSGCHHLCSYTYYHIDRLVLEPSPYHDLKNHKQTPIQHHQRPITNLLEHILPWHNMSMLELNLELVSYLGIIVLYFIIDELHLKSFLIHCLTVSNLTILVN